MTYNRQKTFPLIPRRRIAGLPFGSMRSQRRGQGSDLADIREYVRGDDPRQIDWRRSALLSATRNIETFVVRVHHAEESVGVVLFVDRRPSMAMLSYGLPGTWFDKNHAVITAGTMIVNSAIEESCPVGYLDYACYGYPDPVRRNTNGFWRPPNQETEAKRVRERNLLYPSDPGHFAPPAFFAPEDNLVAGFQKLLDSGRSIPKGSFIFVLSDFLALPGEEAWGELSQRGWDVVPVILQDPVWERSFPDVGGITLPMRDPKTGKVSRVRFSEREIGQRRLENERRLASTLSLFEQLNYDFVMPESHDEDEIHQAFSQWARQRSTSRRLRR